MAKYLCTCLLHGMVIAGESTSRRLDWFRTLSGTNNESETKAEARR